MYGIRLTHYVQYILSIKLTTASWQVLCTHYGRGTQPVFIMYAHRNLVGGVQARQMLKRPTFILFLALLFIHFVSAKLL